MLSPRRIMMKNLSGTTTTTSEIVFARSLQCKLQMQYEMDQINGYQAGTTFPPQQQHSSGGGLLLQTSVKHHRSESDLASSYKIMKSELRRTEDEDDDDDENEDDENNERAENLTTAQKNTAGTDSDLFFDFDIGSPVSSSDRGNESDEDQLICQMASINHGVDVDVDDLGSDEIEDQEDQGVEEEVELGRSLPPEDWFRDRENLSSSSASSTPIQVYISGDPPKMNHEMSDEPLISPDSLLEEGYSSASTSTAAASTAETPSAEIPKVIDDDDDDDDDEIEADKTEIEEESEAKPEEENENKKNNDKNEDEDEDENVDEDGNLRIISDNKEHVIANSKLTALISSLETNRVYTPPKSSPSPPQHQPQLSVSSSSSPPHPTKTTSDPAATTITTTESTAVAIMGPKKYNCTLPTIAASPVNFSFLSVALDKQSLLPPIVPQDRERSASAVNCTELQKSIIEAHPSTVLSAVVKDEQVKPSSGRILRSSSLKTTKTPPGSPSHRKIVRFADVLGLDLADVKTFLDEIPHIPKSAFRHLKDAEIDHDQHSSSPSSSGHTCDRIANELGCSLMPMFKQPGSSGSFIDLLRDQKVILENAYYDNLNNICGVVRVQNINFHKQVVIRYTTDSWNSFSDVGSDYVNGSNDGFSDKFSFKIALRCMPQVGNKLEFCIRFKTPEAEFWDSHGGANYIFQCLNNPSTTGNTVTKPQSIPLNNTSSAANSSSNASQSSHRRGGGGGGRDYFDKPLSQSPSTFTEDPWLRYM